MFLLSEVKYNQPGYNKLIKSVNLSLYFFKNFENSVVLQCATVKDFL